MTHNIMLIQNKSVVKCRIKYIYLKNSYLFYKVNYKILILKQDIKNIWIENCQIGTRRPALKRCIHLPFCPLQNVTDWSILSASSIAKPSRVNLLCFAQVRKEVSSLWRRWVCQNKLPVQLIPDVQTSSPEMSCTAWGVSPAIIYTAILYASQSTTWC